MGIKPGAAAREIEKYRDDLKKSIFKRDWVAALLNAGRLQGYLNAIEEHISGEGRKLIYPEIDRVINCAMRKDREKCIINFTKLDAALVNEFRIPLNFKL